MTPHDGSRPAALLNLHGDLKLSDVTDRIRVATETLHQGMIDAGASAFIGATPFERSADRTSCRNGTRPRTLSTTARDLDLKIPKLRAGSFFPALLERRRRRDRTLAAQDFPYVFLDTVYFKARVGRRIVSQAMVVAVGVAADGRRDVLGFHVGDSKNEDFWTSFLQQPRRELEQPAEVPRPRRY